MSFRVTIIDDSKGMRDFTELPFRIYRDDPRWIPPLTSVVARTLDEFANPYFSGVDLKKIVCYNGNEPVARSIAVINPRHWEKFHTKTAFFGFFESVDDGQVSSMLLDKVEEYCRNKGAEDIQGPFNPNHYSELGMLVGNFEKPAFFESYNPAYYPALIRKAGYRTIYRMHTRIVTAADHPVPPGASPGLSQAKRKGFTIRRFNLFRMSDDLERIREVFNDAFADNWNFLPLSREEYRFSAKSLFAVTNPSLIRIVEHVGKPVGVLQCMLNINPLLHPLKGRIGMTDIPRLLAKRRAVTEVVIYAIGIKKVYRNSPAFILLTDAMRTIMQRYPVVRTTWMSDDNPAAVRASEIIGLKPCKWFEIYGKSL